MADATRRGLNLRARRTSPDEPRTYRLANSIRLPWGIGLASLLLLAIAAAAVLGRTSDRPFDVPDVVLGYQEQITNDAAQSVRRGVNEGVDDLAELALVLGAASEIDGVRLRETLAALGDLHGRYLSVYVLNARGDVVASAGAEPEPDLLDPAPPYDEAGMLDARLHPSGDKTLIHQFAPFERVDGVWTVVGLYDPSFLRFPLEGALPGEAFVVNSEGEYVGGIGEGAPLGSLSRQTLRDAAARAAGGGSGVEVVGGSLDRQEIIGYAPVAGIGPSGQLGWGVVTTRSVASFSLPETDTRRQGVVLAIVLAILSAVVFAWLYIVVIRPVLQVQREAERLAFGDLSKGVEVVRYDEIGLIARALERIRILLIRKRTERPRQK